MLSIVNKIKIAKPNEPETSNEDAIIADVEKQLFGISDGAGGEGICAGKWSSYLLQNLPNNPIKNSDDLNSWIDTIYKKFEEELIPTLQDTALEKYYKQGSLATLSAIWVLEKKIHYTMIGDSLMMCYNAEKKTLKTVHENPVLLFDNNPYLININAPVPKNAVTYGEYSAKPNELFIISSDALAKFIINAYYKFTEPKSYKKNKKNIKTATYKNYLEYFDIAIKPFKNFDEIMQQLYTCTPELLYEWYQHKLLSYDDYSLIILK